MGLVPGKAVSKVTSVLGFGLKQLAGRVFPDRNLDEPLGLVLCGMKMGTP